jgi:hypothetical protein
MVTVQDILTRLHPQIIAEVCDIPNDEARAQYAIQRIRVRDYREFQRAILDYLKFHSAKVYGQPFNDINAMAFAQEALGSLPNVAYIGLSGDQGGMMGLFTKCAEEFKKKFRQNYYQLVLNEMVDPLDPDQKIALMADFKQHMERYAPSHFSYMSAEAMAADYRGILWQYIEAIGRHVNLYRYY